MRIENTAKTAVRPDWVMGGNPQAIEDQEAEGQRQLTSKGDQLPVKCSEDDRKALVRAGVEFGPAHKGDPLFCTAKLPEGWLVRPTDHSMWSELVDETGTVRANIFYKAAFYDRDAFIRLPSSPARWA